MKTLTKWIMMLVLLSMGVAMVGCEGKVDDDGAKIKVGD